MDNSSYDRFDPCRWYCVCLPLCTLPREKRSVRTRSNPDQPKTQQRDNWTENPKIRLLAKLIITGDLIFFELQRSSELRGLSLKLRKGFVKFLRHHRLLINGLSFPATITFRMEDREDLISGGETIGTSRWTYDEESIEERIGFRWRTSSFIVERFKHCSSG